MNAQLSIDPARPPIGWQCTLRSEDGAKYERILTGQTVIVSEDIEQDGRRWRHFSTAFPNRLPTWDEFVATKEAFLGAESKAIQVLAPRSQWVNINPYVLHLFECMDADPLPDFTRGLGTL